MRKPCIKLERRTRLGSASFPVALLLGLALCGSQSACSVRTEGTGRGVLLIAIDELRADHLSGRGYDRETTPQLDQLATHGVSFARAFSSASLLIPAHASLLTGCYPKVSHRRIPERIQIPESNRWLIPASVPHLAVEFLNAGYATAAFIDTEALLPSAGFDSGFQLFERDDSRKRRKQEERGGAVLSSLLRGWLADVPTDENWFAYLHLRDLDRIWNEISPEWDDYFSARPGTTYVPPVGVTDKVLFAVPKSRWGGLLTTLGGYERRYDGALRRIDQALGRLFRSLELEGRWNNTTVSVVGTYGLQFGEDGLILRSGMLSVPDLQVPWILRLSPSRGSLGAYPDQRTEPGTVFDHLASLVDVAPTLLDWEGIKIPDGTHGRSHVPVLVEGASKVRDYAFASEGLIDGSVVFGEEWALEELLFSAATPELREQWFGVREPDEELMQRGFYRYGHRAGPLRDGAESAELEAELPAEVAQALSTALEQWRLNTTATWAVLQTS
ncbi:MAG: hypothetical protein ACI8TQ_002539, partial [Planctomycetota bacterium]